MRGSQELGKRVESCISIGPKLAGALWISGLISEDETDILEEFESAGFAKAVRKERAGWLSFRFKVR